MSLVIPDQHKQGLADFIKLTKSTSDALLRAISTSEPAFSPTELATQLQSVGLPADKLRGMLIVLSSLILTAYDRQMALEELATDVATSAAQAHVGDLTPDSAETAAFRDRLIAFLTDPRLQVATKAAYVMIQHPAVYHSARVLTDLRPILSVESPPELGAAVIVHVLQLTTLQDGEEHSVFVALDSHDIPKLRAALDRALAKETALRTAMASTKLPILHLPAER